MPKLLKESQYYHVQTQTWLCELENETGTETEEQIKAQFDIQVAKIPDSAPAGSFAQLPTESKGLFVRMKNPQGKWIDI